MDIRCMKCGALTPLKARSKRVQFLVDCRGCGRGYSVSELQRLAPLHHSRALGYANSNQFDIASAYIALPGVIEIDGGVTGVATAAPAGPSCPVHVSLEAPSLGDSGPIAGLTDGRPSPSRVAVAERVNQQRGTPQSGVANRVDWREP